MQPWRQSHHPSAVKPCDLQVMNHCWLVWLNQVEVWQLAIGDNATIRENQRSLDGQLGTQNHLAGISNKHNATVCNSCNLCWVTSVLFYCLCALTKAVLAALPFWSALNCTRKVPLQTLERHWKLQTRPMKATQYIFLYWESMNIDVFIFWRWLHTPSIAASI